MPLLAKVASTALFFLVMLSWPTLVLAQSPHGPRIDQNLAFRDAPGGGAAVEEQLQGLAVLAADRLTAKARRTVTGLLESAAGKAITFRVGMFFEDVSQNMLDLLLAAARTGATCEPRVMALVGNVKTELKDLESKNRGNGAVFGRRAFDAAFALCPGG